MCNVLPSAERPPGYDRVRNAEIGNKDFELDVLEEAYTTEHWLVRIYKVGGRGQRVGGAGRRVGGAGTSHGQRCVPQVKDLDNRGLSRT